MAEYISTLSPRLYVVNPNGIDDIPVIKPSGSDWAILSQTFIPETSQICWTWKKEESPVPVKINNTSPVIIAQSGASYNYKTLSIDINGVREINGDDDDNDSNVQNNSTSDEKVLLAIRPKTGGIIVPDSFGVMSVGNEYVVARLYVGDIPSGGTWFDYGDNSRGNRNVSTTQPPSNKNQLGTIYVDQQNRSDKCDISGQELSDTSKAIFVAAKSFSGKAKVAAFITWRERSV